MTDPWEANDGEVSVTLKPPRGTGEEWVVYRGQDLEQVLAKAERDLDRGLYTRLQQVGVGFRAQYVASLELGAKPVPQEELDKEAAGVSSTSDEARDSGFVNSEPIWFTVPFGKNKQAREAGLLFSKEHKLWGTRDEASAKVAEAAGFVRKG